MSVVCLAATAWEKLRRSHGYRADGYYHSHVERANIDILFELPGGGSSYSQEGARIGGT